MSIIVDDDPIRPEPELKCEVCGKELTYSGRGRKPKRCDEHKAGSSAGTGRAARASDKQVEQAVTLLDQSYEGIAKVLMLTGAVESGADLHMARESLKESNRLFLAGDPQLVKAILKTGGKAGRAGFIVSNALILVPIAVNAGKEFGDRWLKAKPTEDDEPEENKEATPVFGPLGYGMSDDG